MRLGPLKPIFGGMPVYHGYSYQWRRDRNGTREPSEQFKCSVCSKTFSTRFSRGRHLETHGPKLHHCPHCNRAFKQQRNVSVHLKKGRCKMHGATRVEQDKNCVIESDLALVRQSSNQCVTKELQFAGSPPNDPHCLAKTQEDLATDQSQLQSTFHTNTSYRTSGGAFSSTNRDSSLQLSYGISDLRPHSSALVLMNEQNQSLDGATTNGKLMVNDSYTGQPLPGNCPRNILPQTPLQCIQHASNTLTQDIHQLEMGFSTIDAFTTSNLLFQSNHQQTTRQEHDKNAPFLLHPNTPHPNSMACEMQFGPPNIPSLRQPAEAIGEDAPALDQHCPGGSRGNMLHLNHYQTCLPLVNHSGHNHNIPTADNLAFSTSQPNQFSLQSLELCDYPIYAANARHSDEIIPAMSSCNTLAECDEPTFLPPLDVDELDYLAAFDTDALEFLAALDVDNNAWG
ncbi:uncharacterized protein BDV17DRAFT_255485 [Aspergillus undulatus]|uniref:uncharacterized protein n=1 Tax=Aspergillus undulatus TaxID=1810928 RepID=UPI003CCE4CDE